ncbi:hypothetical protein KL907_004027 [Ogataea polymorpha]|nr:hypothetical protein KL937_003154 [Ogataea polymorpha]KAG7902894.1 hypothetical protein KL907_004027 [Ogataea polymorpha]KAG7935001.1 hypothetical protein KL904_003333 [Ogataea polymorpha]
MRDCDTRRNAIDDEHGCSRRQCAHEGGGCAKIAEAGPEIGSRAEFQEEAGHVGDNKRHEEGHGDERGDLVDVGKQKQLAQQPREEDAVDGVCAENAQPGQNLVDCDRLEQFCRAHKADNDRKH